MILLDVSHYKCPNCQSVIEVDQIQDFNTRFSYRNAFTCPSCETKVNWEKKTHSLAHYSMWLAFLSLPLPFLDLYTFGAGIWIFFFFMILSGVGMMMKHLVIEKVRYDK